MLYWCFQRFPRDIKEEFEKHSGHFPILPSQDDKDAAVELQKKVEQAKTRILEENIRKPQKIDLVSLDRTFMLCYNVVR